MVLLTHEMIKAIKEVAEEYMTSMGTAIGWEQDAEKLEAQARALRRAAKEAKQKLVASHLGAWTVNGSELSVDTDYWAWDCPTSPTKKCVYNDELDWCHDECIFCGDPYERK